MSSLKLLHSGGNGVIISAPSSNPASNITFAVPNADGSANQVLKTDGSGSLGWTSNNSMTLLSTTSLSSSGNVIANVSFSLTDYKILYGEMYSVARPSGNIGDVSIRFNGVSSTIYKYVMQRMDNSGSYSDLGDQAKNAFYYNMTGVAGWTSGVNFAHFSLHLVNEGVRKTFEMVAGGELSSGSIVLTTNGYWDSTAAVTSVEVQCSDTDINGGTLKLYGVK